MNKTAWTTSLLAAAFMAASAFAQVGGGGMGPGPGPGPGGGKGRFAWNQNHTPGWALMTPEERTAFQAQMREVKTYEECVATVEAHRAAMAERAKEKGLPYNPPPRNGCDVMKARGLIK